MNFKFRAIAFIIIAGLWAGLMVSIYLDEENQDKYKCDVFTATVNNSNQQTSKVTIKDDRFVDGTEVEVQICGENYQVKPVDK